MLLNLFRKPDMPRRPQPIPVEPTNFVRFIPLPEKTVETTTKPSTKRTEVSPDAMGLRIGGVMLVGAVVLGGLFVATPVEQEVVVCQSSSDPRDQRNEVSPEQWQESLGSTEPDAGIYIAHKTYATRQIREITQVQAAPTADGLPAPNPTLC